MNWPVLYYWDKCVLMLVNHHLEENRVGLVSTGETASRITECLKKYGFDRLDPLTPYNTRWEQWRWGETPIPAGVS